MPCDTKKYEEGAFSESSYIKCMSASYSIVINVTVGWDLG